jgi:hypothetical protein
MSLLIASPATRAPAIRVRHAADRADRNRDTEREMSRTWVLLTAFAYAGAYIDPTGALAAQRLARIPEV